MRVERGAGPVRTGFTILLLVFALFAPVSLLNAAGEATPVAADPALEVRVRALSENLRCLVCQNESVAESRAPLAVDLRAQVREQLGAGKSEKEVLDFMVSRYGDFVLYSPPFKASTAILWLGPAALLFGCVGWLLLRLRNRERESLTAPHLTEEERKRARALLEGAPAESEEQQP